ncbi:(deoxy)nucleoside triphosphate pyrophosphohydrolase [Algoriphagus sp. CAU 1675]|uniref:(deoxy)nucleoside triphosphate pyrophosphohydrolase n=1 Tax=Algoriphagus sp. CAU 1675 TaxID=3032597 RepID=UPI0023DA3FA3|nr:(deoxy)nucleoside triphosphate pyrophosphohydrolase [Algoriphagus sp. CAU 1675]MDF2157401.1 (deoxy)nucleoside triphosphate pyrophosphohydrolase [Algoriphagus sp. CAU 1675]
MIFQGEKVLAVKRSKSMPLAGFWEFPGGKIEKGESPEECLKREIKEELALEIELVQPLSPVEYTYSAPTTIQLIPFVVRIKGGEIKLAEHEEYRWLGQKELFEVNWAPADIPIVEELSSIWGCLISKQ